VDQQIELLKSNHPFPAAWVNEDVNLMELSKLIAKLQISPDPSS
jgi:hypothetical protein